MAREFKLPDPGEGIHEAEIIEIRVSEGDRVAEGDVLAVVETDKAEAEVTSPFSGTIESVAVSDGDDLRVGDVLLTYSEEGAGESDKEKGAERARRRDAEGRTEPAEDEGDEDEQLEKEPEEGERDEATKGEEQEPDEEEEQEPDEEDEQEPDEEPGEDEDDEGRRKSRAAGKKEAPAGPVPAAPTTRRLARELDVDLGTIEGTGRDGRVTDDDVRRAAGKAPVDERGERAGRAEEPEGALPPSRWPLTPRRAELPDFSDWGPVERVRLRSVRRATAQRMALAWSQVPHVTHEDVADITELERFRRSLAPRVEEQGGKLTLTTLVVKAVVAALKEHPRFNASLDPEAGEIVLKRYYHIGVAVASERGLLVPVIRDVDRKTLVELAVELATLAERARDGELELAEMRGGSFSITNPGGIGGTRFTPIVNFPQVAILGLGRAVLEPVASGDIDSATVSHRFRLPLCLGFDHRVNDGADAARFVNHIRRTLADPEAFTLAV